MSLRSLPSCATPCCSLWTEAASLQESVPGCWCHACPRDSGACRAGLQALQVLLVRDPLLVCHCHCCHRHAGHTPVSSMPACCCMNRHAEQHGAGASAKRLVFKGSEAKHGYWNKGISGCSICDGPSHRFRDQPVAVVGGGDGAMEEVSAKLPSDACCPVCKLKLAAPTRVWIVQVMYLAKYASKVYVVHRRGQFTASKIMQRRVLTHPKVEASDSATNLLASLSLQLRKRTRHQLLVHVS